MSGHEHQFEITHIAVQALEDMARAGNGGILVSAHLGKWEMRGALLRKYNHVYNIVMYEGEDQKIRAYLDSEGVSRKFNIIQIKEDMSHIYEMSAALNRNEFICMHADRYMEGNRTIEGVFLGQKAKFPLGPFALAS